MINREATETNSNEPLILSLDTSSKLTSLAIARGEKLIATFGAELDETRSTRLWNVIDYLLNAVGLKIDAVDLFAVCTGPGGFTGVRVGMAVAKAFASATGKLTVGVTSLEASAACVPFTKNVCVILNAYKGEVYSQLFELPDNRQPLPLNEPAVGALQKALERVAQVDNLVFATDSLVLPGDGAKPFRQAINETVLMKESPRHWQVFKHTGFLAEAVARLGFLKMQAGEAVSAELLQATYVRGADIKIKVQV